MTDAVYPRSELDWADILRRSSVGDPVSRSLAKRAPRARIDDLLAAIKDDPAISDDASVLQTTPLKRHDLLDVDSVARGYMSLYFTVSKSPTKEYVSRRLLSVVLVLSGAHPAPCDNPILSSPETDTTGRTRVVDDVAMVAMVHRDRPEVFWPRIINHGGARELELTEDYLDSLRGVLHEVDLAPHAYWQTLRAHQPARELKHSAEDFVLLFIWRVVDPARIVRHNVNRISHVMDRWIQRHRQVLEEQWHTTRSPTHRRTMDKLARDPYWSTIGLAVTMDLFPLSIRQDLSPCARLPHVREFLGDALHDEKRWFSGTAERINAPLAEPDDPLSARELQRIGKIVRMTTGPITLDLGEPVGKHHVEADHEPAYRTADSSRTPAEASIWQPFTGQVPGAAEPTGHLSPASSW
jgi:hypothetical protein